MLVENLIINTYGQGQLNLMQRGHAPKGVVIHNTADNMGPEQRISMLENHNLERGFAHYYIDGGKVQQVMGENYIAWHTANQTGNTEYIGIEVGNSTGDEATFLHNEDLAFDLAKTILDRYNLPVNQDTVRLHKQFVATACPHRSTELHGVDPLRVQSYFIERVSGVKQPEVTPGQPSNTEPVGPKSDVAYMRDYGYVIWNGKQFDVDDSGKINGIWQVISNELGGLRPSPTTSAEEWLNNGVPMAGIDWTDGTDQNEVNGERFKFMDDRMTITGYDDASNGLRVNVAGYDVWVDATVAKNA